MLVDHVNCSTRAVWRLEDEIDAQQLEGASVVILSVMLDHQKCGDKYLNINSF